jgi:hypothetical protein
MEIKIEVFWVVNDHPKRCYPTTPFTGVKIRKETTLKELSPTLMEPED